MRLRDDAFRAIERQGNMQPENIYKAKSTAWNKHCSVQASLFLCSSHSSYEIPPYTEGLRGQTSCSHFKMR